MRILVVDDEELVVEFLKRSLRFDKHIVDVAYNGQTGFQKALQHSYDVIVLDVVMPHKDGLTTCRDLRKAGIHTPILMLTSRVAESERIAGLDSGADDYLAKPFSYDELMARLRALTRRPPAVIAPELRVGTLWLDPIKKVIYQGNEPLDLRPKEYALLEYLMRHPGKVISREEFLRDVWYISAHNASNRLEVCIHNIRTKVNAQTNGAILKTIRGYGYVLDAALHSSHKEAVH